MWYTPERTEALLYYLYMMCDGEITCDEEIIFESICKKLHLIRRDIEVIIEESERLTKRSKSIINIIKCEQLVEKTCDIGMAKYAKVTSARTAAKSKQAMVIWNLVNIGYADESYSEEEKEIVNYVIKKCKFDGVIFQEIIDTAETISDLTKQKEWLLSNKRRGKGRDEKDKEIDSEIESILDDLKLTI